MKLSDETLAVLKNFSSINQSILIRSGNVLRTVSPQKTMMARVDVNESFPQEFAIFDLPKFLGVLSLFKEPEITFDTDFLTVGDGKNSVKYVFADPSIIVAAKDQEISLPSVDVTFKVTADQLQNVLKAAGVIGVDDVTFEGDGKVLKMVAHEKKNKSSNKYVLDLAETDLVFNVDFKVSNFKMLMGDYTVEISKKLISSFKSEKATYWVACESTSNFS